MFALCPTPMRSNDQHVQRQNETRPAAQRKEMAGMAAQVKDDERYSLPHTRAIICTFINHFYCALLPLFSPSSRISSFCLRPPLLERSWTLFIRSFCSFSSRKLPPIHLAFPRNVQALHLFHHFSLSLSHTHTHNYRHLLSAKKIGAKRWRASASASWWEKRPFSSTVQRGLGKASPVKGFQHPFTLSPGHSAGSVCGIDGWWR